MPIRSLPPNKKRKTQKDATEFESSLRSLENTLTSAATNNSSLNPLADLVDLAYAATNAQDVSKAIYSLYRVFVVIITGGRLDSGEDETTKVVRRWIMGKLDSYVKLLAGLLQDEEPTLRVCEL